MIKRNNFDKDEYKIKKPRFKKTLKKAPRPNKGMKNPNSGSTGRKAKLIDLCEEDKSKIGELIKKLADEKEQKSELSRKQKMREERMKRKQEELARMVKDLINDNKKLNSDKEQLESKLKESVGILKSYKDVGEGRSKASFVTSYDTGEHSGRDFRRERFKKMINGIKNSSGKKEEDDNQGTLDLERNRVKRVKAESCRFDQRNFDLDFVGNKTEDEKSEFFISKKRVKPSILESNNIDTPDTFNYQGFKKEQSPKEKTVKFEHQEEPKDAEDGRILVLEDRSIHIQDKHYIPKDIIFSEKKNREEPEPLKKRVGRRKRSFLKKRDGESAEILGRNLDGNEPGKSPVSKEVINRRTNGGYNLPPNPEKQLFREVKVSKLDNPEEEISAKFTIYEHRDVERKQNFNKETIESIQKLKNEILEIKGSLKVSKETCLNTQDMKIMDIKDAVDNKKQQFREDLEGKLLKMETELVGRKMFNKEEEIKRERLRRIYEEETSSEDEEDIITERIKKLHQKKIQRLRQMANFSPMLEQEDLQDDFNHARGYNKSRQCIIRGNSKSPNLSKIEFREQNEEDLTTINDFIPRVDSRSAKKGRFVIEEKDQRDEVNTQDLMRSQRVDIFSDRYENLEEPRQFNMIKRASKNPVVAQRENIRVQESLEISQKEPGLSDPRSTGPLSFDNMSPEELIFFKKMIEEKLNSSSNRRKGHKRGDVVSNKRHLSSNQLQNQSQNKKSFANYTIEEPQDRPSVSTIQGHEPEDPTSELMGLDYDEYDDNFLSLVEELEAEKNISCLPEDEYGYEGGLDYNQTNYNSKMDDFYILTKSNSNL